MPATGASGIDRRAQRSPLLYVSDQIENTVFVYTYPQLKPAGKLTGFSAPGGLCVNRRNGNIWVADQFHSALVEFAHGGSAPIRTIHEGHDYVAACAVDPKSGDVALIATGSDDPGKIVVFKPGHGPSNTYSDDKHLYWPGYASYDASGNLFVDGTHFGVRQLALDELAKGADKLTNVPWHGPRDSYAGGMQFDGSDLAIGDASKHLIYRTNAGRVSTTMMLRRSCLVRQFFIHDGVLIAPSACKKHGNVLIYPYPAGGEPVDQLGGLRDPVGAVLSP